MSEPMSMHGFATAPSETVLASWRRCRWNGLNPSTSSVATVDIDGDSPLARAALPVLEELVGHLSDSRICVALGNSRGHVVWRAVPDPAVAHQLESAGLVSGSNLAEEFAGTNGIGTALESRRQVTITGADHFREGMKQWFCVASPVRHPITRRVCGVINLTCPDEDATPLLAPTASALAAAVTNRLEAAASASERRLLDAFTTARSRTTAPLMVVGQRIVIADDAAARFNVPHERLRDLLDAAGPHASEIELQSGLLAQVWPLNETSPGEVLLVLQADASTGASVEGGSVELSGPGGVGGQNPVSGNSRLTPLQLAEASTIAGSLNDFDGNKTAAAEYLGISRATLYQKIRQYRIVSLPTGPTRNPLWNFKA